MDDTVLTQKSDDGRKGNTKGRRNRNWVFTWNNYTTDDINYIISNADTEKYEFLFQEEMGESGTPHLQGLLKFENARYFGGVKALFPSIHLEPCKNYKKAIEYCRKDKSCIGNEFHNMKGLRKRNILIKELYEWQKNVINIIHNNDNDDRKIYWFYDITGNKGKTALCKYICCKYNAVYLNGGSKDCKYAITNYLEDNNELDVVVFDFCRSQEERISYQAIEEIKNGIFFNTKYESKMCVFNSPKVICFSNFHPNTFMLSADRWIIEELH